VLVEEGGRKKKSDQKMVEKAGGEKKKEDVRAGGHESRGIPAKIHSSLGSNTEKQPAQGRKGNSGTGRSQRDGKPGKQHSAYVSDAPDRGIFGYLVGQKKKKNTICAITQRGKKKKRTDLYS